MNESTVEDRLKSIGMKIFVSYYYYFKNERHDRAILADKLLRENTKATSINAQMTRISKARKIFVENQHLTALELIINSNRMENSVTKKAKEILIKEGQNNT